MSSNSKFLAEFFRGIPRVHDIADLCASYSAAIELIDSLYYQTNLEGRTMLVRMMLRIGEAFDQQIKGK